MAESLHQGSVTPDKGSVTPVSVYHEMLSDKHWQIIKSLDKAAVVVKKDLTKQLLVDFLRENHVGKASKTQSKDQLAQLAIKLVKSYLNKSTSSKSTMTSPPSQLVIPTGEVSIKELRKSRVTGELRRMESDELTAQNTEITSGASNSVTGEVSTRELRKSRVTGELRRMETGELTAQNTEITSGASNSVTGEVSTRKLRKTKENGELITQSCVVNEGATCIDVVTADFTTSELHKVTGETVEQGEVTEGVGCRNVPCKCRVDLRRVLNEVSLPAPLDSDLHLNDVITWLQLHGQIVTSSCRHQLVCQLREVLLSRQEKEMQYLPDLPCTHNITYRKKRKPPAQAQTPNTSPVTRMAYTAPPKFHLPSTTYQHETALTLEFNNLSPGVTSTPAQNSPLNSSLIVEISNLNKNSPYKIKLTTEMQTSQNSLITVNKTMDERNNNLLIKENLAAISSEINVNKISKIVSVEKNNQSSVQEIKSYKQTTENSRTLAAAKNVNSTHPTEKNASIKIIPSQHSIQGIVQRTKTARTQNIKSTIASVKTANVGNRCVHRQILGTLGQAKNTNCTLHAEKTGIYAVRTLEQTEITNYARDGEKPGSEERTRTRESYKKPTVAWILKTRGKVPGRDSCDVTRSHNSDVQRTEKVTQWCTCHRRERPKLVACKHVLQCNICSNCNLCQKTIRYHVCGSI